MDALERGQLTVMRIHYGAASALAVVAAIFVDWLLSDQLGTPLGIVGVPVLLFAFYAAFVAPRRRYRAWGYAIDEDNLRIARGVWHRVETIVPLSRVQHIDISQGPVERACGVCRLVLHTAGTMHSRVVLPGLERARAEKMRGAIRARIGTGPL
ncbi:PH domain-containing protein [Sphingomonas sp. LY54]|uniref:PH domain-containing protein n=1 Tax=Sphingomonas sp. LY54 TaxID=3095343 RepID=UPI002D7859A2|nr:PH domain-containing protein [Sphingomonas sp. LY54]WRP28483.1 PH domain-containing protein [Sphingomonas sp. LY54]